MNPTPILESIVRARRPLSTAERWARRIFFGALGRATRGHLQVKDADGTTTFLRPSPDHEPAAVIEIADPALYRRVLTGGSIGAGEAFADGQWDSPDLTALCRYFVANRDALNAMDGGFWGGLGRAAAKAVHALRANTRAGAKRNIENHYDLGNDFFETFLDETWTYSSALFEGGASLAQAQTAKNDRLCRKLRLTPQDHLLEIGTGWGGFALHAAGTTGCRVTTATISKAQHALAVERVKAAGLEGRVTVLLEDYRNLTGRYDKLASVEMIEAVGLENLGVYFRALSRLLKPDGAAAIQSITIQDRFYEQARRSVDFIQKHIFPGSGIPALSAILESVRDDADLRLVHLEDFGPHYAKTLQLWHERLIANAGAAARRGYGERLQRLWRFYFSYCEAGFLERQIGVAQLVFAKPENRMEPLLGAL